MEDFELACASPEKINDMADTKIEWCDKVWNPVIGCTKCSPGCLNCYAERMAKRLYWMGMAEPSKLPEYMKFKDGWKKGHIECCEHRLNQPLDWRKPKSIFVCSMSDLFHPKVPFEFIDRIIGTTIKAPQHTYQILTKRPQIMTEWVKHFIVNYNAFYHSRFAFKQFQKHIHFGASISTQAEADEKIPILLQIPSAVRWLSIEPMLGPIDLRCLIVGPRRRCVYDCLRGCAASESGVIYDRVCGHVNGIVVGGESGPGARPMKPDWVRNIRDQCIAAGVPFYFKQWGAYIRWHGLVVESDFVFLKDGRLIDTKDVFRDGWQKYYDTPTDCIWMKRVGKKKAGCILDGKEWKQYPK